MLQHQVILGLLRDGEQRHGYQLRVQYRDQTGDDTGTNVHWQLSRLVSRGYVERVACRAEDPPRRVFYRITARGQEHFDRWVSQPPIGDDQNFRDWLLFAPLVPDDVRDRILLSRCTALELRLGALSRRRGDARDGASSSRAGLAVLALETRRLTAELEYIRELRGLCAHSRLASSSLHVVGGGHA